MLPNRDELALKFVESLFNRTSPGGLLTTAEHVGAKHLAESVAEVSYALADAMIAKSGESK